MDLFLERGPVHPTIDPLGRYRLAEVVKEVGLLLVALDDNVEPLRENLGIHEALESRDEERLGVGDADEPDAADIGGQGVADGELAAASVMVDQTGVGEFLDVDFLEFSQGFPAARLSVVDRLGVTEVELGQLREAHAAGGLAQLLLELDEVFCQGSGFIEGGHRARLVAREESGVVLAIDTLQRFDPGEGRGLRRADLRGRFTPVKELLRSDYVSPEDTCRRRHRQFLLKEAGGETRRHDDRDAAEIEERLGYPSGKDDTGGVLCQGTIPRGEMLDRLSHWHGVVSGLPDPHPTATPAG